MIRIDGIKLPVLTARDPAADIEITGTPETELLRRKCAKALRIAPESIKSLSIAKKSIDARDKSNIQFVYSVDVELPKPSDEARCLRLKHVARVKPFVYSPPVMRSKPRVRPVVAGCGPAGLFAALTLCLAGAPPLLIERGCELGRRSELVRRFWARGELDTDTNVQFGEGGAGAFSDGKLTTGINDPRTAFVLETLIRAGAPADIAYAAKPHIGTDILPDVVRNLRQRLIGMGAEISFESRLAGIRAENGRLVYIQIVSNGVTERVPAESLILAVGHSARDTFEALLGAGVAMRPKPFAVGVRIEHAQSFIDGRQYGAFARHAALGPAEYKLAARLSGGRGAFTFCMCPGGTVVAAASERDGVVTNGMSSRARDAQNANSALLIGVEPADWGGGTLGGAEFQRDLERAAFALGGGAHKAPVQLVGDFLAGRPSDALGSVWPTYSRGFALTDLRGCLPGFVADGLKEALPLFDRKLPGFAARDAVLTAVETRSSSPMTITREADFQSNIAGLYPCGEGAGHAGGIMSAAADGMRCAEALARNIR